MHAANFLPAGARAKTFISELSFLSFIADPTRAHEFLFNEEQTILSDTPQSRQIAHVLILEAADIKITGLALDTALMG